MLDTIMGLPLHPLVVHAAVVLLPLTSLGIIALALRPAWRARFALPLLGLLAIGTASALAAKLSGERLAERVGLPADHERLGNWLLVASAIYLVVGGGWLWWVRRDEEDPGGRRNIAGWVVAAFSLAILGLTGLVGHSGATAVWSDVVSPLASVAPSPTAASPQPTPPTVSPEPSATPSRISTPPATTDGAGVDSTTGYTNAQIAEHDTAESCWASITGSVYDLTGWIAQHPGGPDRIIALCGTDATAAFTGQHAGNALPAATLERYRLGPLED